MRINRRDFLKYISIGTASLALQKLALASIPQETVVSPEIIASDIPVSQTLVELAELTDDQVTQEIIKSMVDTNPFYALLPFYKYEGEAIIKSRKTSSGSLKLDTFCATNLVGDVEICNIENGLDYREQMAFELSAKARSIARSFFIGMATATAGMPYMNSLYTLPHIVKPTPQKLSFNLLDDLLNTANGADFILMRATQLRAFKILLRNLDTEIEEFIMTLPDGRTTIAYKNTPIFKNDYIPFTNNGHLTSIWAGKIDDGSSTRGLTAIYPKGTNAGVLLNKSEDNTFARVTQKTNLMNLNRSALVRALVINYC